LPPPPGGTAAFFSCKANQRAVEDPTLRQGVFTHFLVRGLLGDADLPLANKPADGIITLAELSAYVANNTYAHVYAKYKVRQSPELRGDYDLNLPLYRIVDALQGKRAGEPRMFASHKIKMRWCPPGTFRMGSPASDEDADDDETPQITVRLTRGYWLGQSEVTQGLWESVMGTTPWVEHGDTDYYRVGANYPASYVNWDDAVSFCTKLTERERAGGRLPSGWSYQLPTEAEWEYACRAGSRTTYSFGDSIGSLGDYAWFEENAKDVGASYAHSVGTKKANDWGLQDMHGNVYEWCSDRYDSDYYSASSGRDPRGPQTGSVRVGRGGSWFVSAWFCRAANRYGIDPSSRSSVLGFRLSLSPSGR
jgi:formylglycine-generating enzyme required for sulfatase activity